MSSRDVDTDTEYIFSWQISEFFKYMDILDKYILEI